MPTVTVPGSALSRRLSEVVGVGLFAVALIWLVALASYDPGDPAWFFSTGATHDTPVNFAGRVGAFMPSVLAEISFLTNRQEAQLLKTPAYKDRIAEALHDAVMKYRRALKRQSALADRP